MSEYDYDLFVIGAGSGGVRAARLAGRLGKRVGLAEEWTVGGTCVHRGCIPKKLYVYASHFAEDFEDAAGYGWTVEGAHFDWPALVAAKTKELARLRGLYESGLSDAGVTLFEGHAVLDDPHTVRIDDRHVTAETVLIATGGRPVMPIVPGAEFAISSDAVFDLPEFPKRLVIYGAGYIALEFAGIFNGLGADVTVIYRGNRILRGFDEDVRTCLQEEMAAKGVRFRLETEIDRIEKTASGLEAVTEKGERVACDQVLMATGRRPNTRGIGLVEAGVELAASGGAVAVDHHSRSTVPQIYAIGDCTNRLNLTPVAIHEAMCLIDTLYRDRPTMPDHRDVATAVFSQPPVGTVGMTEDEVRAEFGKAVVYRARFRPLKHTLSGRAERVMMKLVADAETGRVRGFHMVGMDAAEIAQSLAVAVKAGLTKAQFDATMALHPTTAEELVLMYEPVSA